MSEFMKSSRAIDEIAASATSMEQLREQIKTQLQREGRLVRDSESLGYGVHAVPGQEPEPPAAAQPVEQLANATHMTVVYPRGNDRYEVYANSQKELDEKVAQIYATFGGR